MTWFVGLYQGCAEDQVEVQHRVVDSFNDQQSDIELKLILSCQDRQPSEELAFLRKSGDSPDIVGPVIPPTAHYYADQNLDLKPLVKKYHYDLKQFPQPVVDLNIENNTLIGLPFAVSPGLIYYNIDLFDKAGLAYPPTEFGAKYMLDGKQISWDWDTVAEIARRLTLDTNGNKANSPQFDSTKITQFGFVHQWDSMRSDFATFGGAPVVDSHGKVIIPKHWREEAQWLWRGIWKDHFIPNTNYLYADLLHPSAFASGHVAIARVMIWYTCCLSELKSKWDLAVMPSYQGNIFSPADPETFRILKESKNPDAAFKVLEYLSGEAAFDLLRAYRAFPARPDLYEAYISELAKKYSGVKNWGVIAPSMDYAVIPSHDSAYPSYEKGERRFADFLLLLYGDVGKNINLVKELDKLEADLQKIVDEALVPTETPTLEY